jgi:hypothetical protein
LTELRVKVNQSDAFCPAAPGTGENPNAPMVLMSVAAETAVPVWLILMVNLSLNVVVPGASPVMIL